MNSSIDIQNQAFDGVVDYDNKRDLPQLGAIYFVLNDSEVLYIGQSLDIRLRFNTHTRHSQFSRWATHIAWIKCGIERRLFLEQSMISLFTPPLNGTSSPKRKFFENGRFTFKVQEELEKAIKKQAKDEIRELPNMLRTLVRRGLAASKGVTWEGRQE